VRPAGTNNPGQRQEAVRIPMEKRIDGHIAGVLISPTMTTLRRGFNSHYRFKRVQTASGGYHDQPEKNHESHVHDAAQYAFVGDGAHLEVQGRKRARLGPRQTHASTGDEPAKWG
jgi:hypothetical protein